MEFELKRQEPVYIAIQGKEYPARLTNRAVKELQELWKLGYFDIFDKFTGGTIEPEEIYDLLFVALKSGGVNIAREVFDDMDHDAYFIADVTPKILELFDRSQRVESVLDETTEPGDEDKKKPEAAVKP